MLDKLNAKSVETRKSKSGSNYKVFIFKCIDCDNDIKSQLSQLKTHSGKCKKCTQRKQPYEHIFNELNHTCKTKRIINFDLTYNDFLKLINIGKCHYCNKELTFSKYTRDENQNYTSRAYQLDRKNNNIGYTKSNLVTCCWDCNRIKSDIYTYEEFMKLGPILKQIYEERHKN